jgi:hypothetical protein
LIQEFSTGVQVPVAFSEKEMAESYSTHLKDITEKWIKSEPIVTEH